jgi:hypothetical protein
MKSVRTGLPQISTVPIAGFRVYPVRIFLPKGDLYKSQDDNSGGRYLLRAPFQFMQGTSRES